MPGSMERSVVRVEGRDDKYALINLLIRHGIDYDTKPWPPQYPEFSEIGKLEEMLCGMETAVKVSSGRVVASVLDADSPLLDRWRAIQGRLAAVDVHTPPEPPVDGFIGESATFHTRVGVWLMPDNQRDGKLETFLETLVEENDPLISHATESTGVAKQKGAEFQEVDTRKAVLHSWLAWQKEPGRPYGTAIRAKYFRHDSPAATAFVDWFKRLFQLP